jgi:hypothetical protein
VVEDFTDKPLSPAPDTPLEEHQGLRILGRMIANAIIRDTQRKKSPSIMPPSPKTE